MVSIELTDAKTDYVVGDEFKKPVVTATFSDSTTNNVTNESIFTGYDLSQASSQTVTVSYTYLDITKTETYSINVVAVSTKLKIAVFADVQLCYKSKSSTTSENLGTTANAPLALRDHLKLCKAQNAQVLFMVGDITNNAIEEYYQYFWEIFKGVYGTDSSTYPEIIWNMGNHEWWDKDEHETANAVKLFNDNANIDSQYLEKKSAVPYYLDNKVTIPSYYKVVEGIPFLVVSGENSKGAIGSTLKGEIEDWLSDIAKLPSVQDGGPIYVSYHYPLHTTLTHGHGALNEASVLEDLLKNYPQAIVFTGDTHFPGINERSINQVDFTTINIGSSSYSRMDIQSATMQGEEHFYNLDISKTGAKGTVNGNAGFKSEYTPTIHFVDSLNNNSAKINRYFSNENVNKAQHLGKEWSIPANVTKEKFEYTNARFKSKESANYLYNKDGLNWTSGAKVEFGYKNGQMTVKFPDVEDYHYCEYFKIQVTSNTSNSKTYDVVSNYYKYSTTSEELYFILGELPSGDTYSVKVDAYDFFDNPSTNSLTSSANNLVLVVEPINNQLEKTYTDISKRVNIFDKPEDQNSSIEYYYRGVHSYKFGAVMDRLYYPGGTGADDYISIGYGTGINAAITCAVKNLGENPIKLGITVVDNEGTWKADFDKAYQKEVPANSGWVTLEWNLYSLFGIDGRDAMSQVGLKACSEYEDLENGYEMNFLVAKEDLTGEGEPPIPPRGEVFASGNDATFVLNSISTATGNLTFDVKLDDPSGKVAIAIVNHENMNSDYFGYFDITSATTKDQYAGVFIEDLTDGYRHIVLTFSEITKTVGAKPDTVDRLFIRGSYTTTSGYIDIEPESEPPAIRGTKFSAGDDMPFPLESTPKTTAIVSFDVMFTSGSDTYINVMVGTYSAYNGYFKITPASNGKIYDGVYVTKCIEDDGYLTVTLVCNELTKLNDKPAPTNIEMLYVRGNWSNASGYIDKVSIATK